MEPGSLPVILIILLLMASAFFSASETALVSLSKLRLRYMVDERMKGAKTLEKLIGEGKYLSAILIGNNFVNILISSVVTTIVNKITGGTGGSLMLTTLAVTVIILVFGEITPKSLATSHAEKVSLFVAKPISAITFVMSPLSTVMNLFTGAILRRVDGGGTDAPPSITESELKSLVNVSHEEGVLEPGEQELIHNVFTFGDYDAEDIMTPRTDIVALPLEADYAEVDRVFREEQFSRVPVYKNDMDHIVGILHFKDFYAAAAQGFRIAAHMREPFFSYESKKTLSLLTEMRSMNVNMAVILDEYGGTAGIVSLEDLIEVIVGEIYDEYDDETENEIEKTGENEYSAEGGANLDDFNQETGASLVSDDYETVGGYVMGLLGKMPEAGDVAVDGGITFVVEEVSKNRIEKLRITMEKEEREA